MVARGAAKRCSAFFGGDSGSLMVRSDLVGDAHINAPAGPFGIFRIGQVDPDKGYIHVLDDENLYTLLSELDTVADFVAYLARKEAFLCSGKVVLAPGEEDLLAYYLTHTNIDGEHDFVLPPTVDVLQFDHLYRGMRDNDQYIAKKSADEISYLIDQLIEHVSSNADNRALIDGNELPIGDIEKALRMLAAESRLSRRHLARALVDLLSSASARGRPKSRCVVTSEKVRYRLLLSRLPLPEGQRLREASTVQIGAVGGLLQGDEGPIPQSATHCRIRDGAAPWRTTVGRLGISGCDQLDRERCPGGMQNPA